MHHFCVAHGAFPLACHSGRGAGGEGLLHHETLAHTQNKKLAGRTMDLIGALPLWALVLLGLCLVVLVVAIGGMLFGFFFKLGVAINESRRPPYYDAGDYRLDQGREVRPEQTARPRGE